MWPTTTCRHGERLEALLRGDFSALPGVPADSSVVRKSLTGGFKYRPPVVVQPFMRAWACVCAGRRSHSTHGLGID